MAAEVGKKTPGSTLPSDSWDNKISLESVRREGPVVLFFYPGDWSSVCTDQMSQVQEEIGRFEEKGAKVMGISVGSTRSHRAWAEERSIGFPLLSDFQRQAVEVYGVKHEADFSKRAYFVVDEEGVLRAKKNQNP